MPEHTSTPGRGDLVGSSRSRDCEPRVPRRHASLRSTTSFNCLTATPLDMSGSLLESELERAEALQKSDVSKAEKGYRTVLDRKARE